MLIEDEDKRPDFIKLESLIKNIQKRECGPKKLVFNYFFIIFKMKRKEIINRLNKLWKQYQRIHRMHFKKFLI